MLAQIADIHYIYILNTCSISSYEYPGFCYKLPR
mgnify:CR=1 FL=1|jgi:hypothetical protein